MKPEDIESFILLRNNLPLEDFCGLTPNEVYQLLYSRFESKSPLQFRNNIDNATIDKVPFFRVAEEYLKLIQRDKQIKLTPLGALPKKVMVEIYAHKFLLDEHIEMGITKLWKEEDCISISSARHTVGLAKLTKKSAGKLSLTKNGAKLLQPENRMQLFKTIVTTFCFDFSWAYNDAYIDYPIGQFGFGFSLYLLDQYGDQEQSPKFYADKYLKAFPKFLDYFPDRHYSKGIDIFRYCYEFRTIDNFFEWFGLATVIRGDKYSERDKTRLKRTDLFKELFVFD